MVSSKSLFIGVYASNGLIRILFLPLCYLFLLSPFAALLVRRYHFDRVLLEKIPDDYKSIDRWPQIFLALVSVALVTRLLTGQNGVMRVDGGKRRVQCLPYWITGLGHWWESVLGGEGWLRGVRDSTIHSITRYIVAGAKHDVVLSPSLLGQILEQQDNIEEDKQALWTILHNAFGMPGGLKKQYFNIRPAFLEKLETEIFDGPEMKKVVAASTSILSDSLPDFITFNSSVVDQMPWERVAGVELTDGNEEAETSLFGLVYEFACNAIVPPITGTLFPESYQLLASDLSTFDESFYALAIGFPRFFLVRGLPTATLAKKRLLQNFARLFDELTNPPAKREIADDESMSGEETDADTPTPATAFNEFFTQHNLPMQARAAITVSVIHKLVSQVVPLAFWTLLHIYASSSHGGETTTEKTPLEIIREETKSWAEAYQPDSIHPSFPAPPEISFAPMSKLYLHTSFPFLRSTITESRRLYTSSTTMLKILNPIHLTEHESTRPGAKELWELPPGSYIDAGLSQSLINTSPAHHVNPEKYTPTRFLPSTSTTKDHPLKNTTMPFLDPPSELTTALLVPLIAGILQLWDVSPAPKKSFMDQMHEAGAAAAGNEPEVKKSETGVWEIPRKLGEGAGVRLPRGEVKVRVRRRGGLPGLVKGRRKV
ncbi:hypothetical protein P154DRAFT_602418 [Amniculicola lignicola CBS 123094]|uniref:Cytochrome P450 n=1 Tax=Amniculicola lignicola CBS 123094 TaxID=1392246 RepID=A0A6A5WCN0_9PLEO|nr:hypothetical protein P154DRAFT_602418 [Amniculicola lignicola CBS 123094]